MNGDTAGKVARLQRELQQLRYPGTVDEVGLRLGDPVSLLPVLHFVLLKFSRHVAKSIHKAGYELQGKTDQKFVESAFKLFRDSFGIRTVLTHANFLEQGFAERKLLLLSDVISCSKKIHNDEVRKERLAALKTKQGAHAPETRLYEAPKRGTPEVKVIKATASGRAGAQRSPSPISRPAAAPHKHPSQHAADSKPRATSRLRDRTPHDQDTLSHRAHALSHTTPQHASLAAAATPVHSWFLDPPSHARAARPTHQAAGAGAAAVKPLGEQTGADPAWFTNPAFLEGEEDDDMEPYRDRSDVRHTQHTGKSGERSPPDARADTGTASFRFHNPYLQLHDQAAPQQPDARGVKAQRAGADAGKPQAPQWQRSFVVDTWRGQGAASDSSDDDDCDSEQRYATTRGAGGVGNGLRVDDARQMTDQGPAAHQHADPTLQHGTRQALHGASMHGPTGVVSSEAIDDVRQQVQALSEAVKSLQTALEQARSAGEATATASEARVTVLEARVRHMECELDTCVRRGEYHPSPRPSPSANNTPPAPTPSGAFGSVSPPQTSPPHAPHLPSWLTRTQLPSAPTYSNMPTAQASGGQHDNDQDVQCADVPSRPSVPATGAWGGDTMSYATQAGAAASQDMPSALRSAVGTAERGATQRESELVARSQGEPLCEAGAIEHTGQQQQQCYSAGPSDSARAAACSGHQPAPLPAGTHASLRDSYQSDSQQHTSASYGQSTSVAPHTDTTDQPWADSAASRPDPLRNSLLPMHQPSAHAPSHASATQPATVAPCGGVEAAGGTLRQSGEMAHREGAVGVQWRTDGTSGQPLPSRANDTQHGVHFGAAEPSQVAHDVSAGSMGAWADMGPFNAYSRPHDSYQPMQQPPYSSTPHHALTGSHAAFTAQQQELQGYGYQQSSALSTSFGQDMFAPPPSFSFDPRKVMAAAQLAVSSQDTPFLHRAGPGRGSSAQSLRHTSDSLAGLPTAEASWQSSSAASVAAPARASWEHEHVTRPLSYMQSSAERQGAEGGASHVRTSQSWDRGLEASGAYAQGHSHPPVGLQSSAAHTHSYPTPAPSGIMAAAESGAAGSARGSLSSAPFRHGLHSAAAPESSAYGGQSGAHVPAAAHMTPYGEGPSSSQGWSGSTPGGTASTRDLISSLLSRNNEAQTFLKELSSYRRR